MKRNCTNSALRILSLAIMLVFLAPVMMNGQTGKTNFSGTWILNAEKSTQPQGGGGGGRMGGGNLTAKQDGNVLTVDRTRTNRDGEATTTTSKYTLDGKLSVNTSNFGDAKSTATWSADGKSLTIATTRTFNRDGESREMKSKEVWTLTDGKTLTIKSTFESPNGERVTTMVYDKK